MKKIYKLMFLLSICILLFGCSKNKGYEYDGSIYSNSYNYKEKYCYNYFLDTNTNQAKLYSDIYLTTVDFSYKNIDISNGKKLYTFFKANCKDYSLTVNEARQVFNVFAYENPEFYFLNEIYYNDLTNNVSFEMSSKYYKAKERSRINILISDKLEEIKKTVYSFDDFDKLCYFYEYIISNMTYGSEDSYYAHNIVGFFDKNEGVCETYAKTFTLLLSNYGFETIPVYSKEHVWNCVNVCNNWFMFDLTYSLFGLTEEEYFMAVPDIKYDDLMIKLPTMPTSSLSLGNMLLYEDGTLIYKSHSIDDIYTKFDGGNYEIILDAVNETSVLYRKFPINYINTNYSTLRIISNDLVRDYFDDVFTTYIILTHDLVIEKDVTIERIRFTNRAVYFGKTGKLELPYNVIVNDGATLTVSRKVITGDNIIVLND